MQSRNNRIRPSGALNQYCTLAFVLESLLLVLPAKIVLQHIRSVTADIDQLLLTAWRRFVSCSIANGVISKISGVKLNDYGCTLKAYRREILQGVRLYGEMHRFIPIYAKWMGARIIEIPVRHHPRKFGVSKYGLGRIIKVILDLIVVKFLDQHFVKPIYVFGGFGLLSLAFSAISFVYILYLKFFEGVSMIQTPMPLVTVMCFLVGIVSILMGLLAEMLVRIYFESQRRAADGITRSAHHNSAVGKTDR